MDRLCEEALKRLPADVRGPSYRRADLQPGIVHLGVGAFHRAHQAVYTELALEQAWGPWGVCGVSLRRPDVRDWLMPQDGLYTVAERAGDGEQLRVIGCLRQLLVAPEDPAAVVGRIAAPESAVISLTITEKGYCHDPATGRLNVEHPDIRHDLATPGRPRSAVGILVAGLARRSRQAPPPTVLSCDNLPANGRTLRALVIELAARRDEALARWIEQEVGFPGTMVDRIVPATTETDIAQTARKLTVHDAAPVVCERFRQWVIEDGFVGPRPAWELAGAEIVGEVAPYEEMKLRLLNGSHSALAYLGYLAGFEHVFEVMAEPDFVAFVRKLMAEVAPTLHVPTDLEAYQATLIARFANPALAHRTSQIAMDGSQKLPQRLLAPIRDRLRTGAPIDHLCLAVAGWIRYAAGRDEQDRPIEVADPLATRFAAIAAEAGCDPDALTQGFLGLSEVFDADLPRDSRFVAPLTGQLRSLIVRGARATIADCIAG